MKINSFEIENVKRVRTVAYEPTANGLTVIGGNNGQGKTSILDAIAWALGGAKFAPSNPQRADSTLSPHIKITLDNGLVVERKGKNSDLTVTDPSGKRYGQKLLDSFVEEFALNLPKFMQSSDKDKAETLLKVIGVGDELARLDNEYQSLYNRRHAFGQMVERKDKYAAELPSYPEAPETPISASELIQKNAEILARNGENARKRSHLKEIIFEREKAENELKMMMDRMNQMQAMIAEGQKKLEQLAHDEEIAKKTTEELIDESTDEIQAQLHDIDSINAKVRANMEKEKAVEEARQMTDEYNAMSKQIDEFRKARKDLLNGANLPLPQLGIEDGCLTYKGYKWDAMSGSDQLIVATSIVKALNPQCNFVLMDKLEQMDPNLLQQFDAWLKSEGMQVIATRVSTGDECQIIIEDGLIKEPEPPKFATPMKGWMK